MPPRRAAQRRSRPRRAGSGRRSRPAACRSRSGSRAARPARAARSRAAPSSARAGLRGARVPRRSAGCASRFRLRLFSPAQFLALDLAGGGHRKRVDELDLARILVRREAPPYVVLYFLDKLVRGGIARLQHYECLDDRAAHRVRLADDRGVRDRGMLHQAGLDLGRADAVARALDDVVGAALVPEIAVVVALALVAGAGPVADELVARGLRILPVLEEEHGIALVAKVAMHRDLAQLAARQLLAFAVDDRHPVPGVRPADRAGLHRPGRLAVADDVIDLGLAEHLVDRDPELGARPFDHRRAH